MNLMIISSVFCSMNGNSNFFPNCRRTVTSRGISVSLRLTNLCFILFNDDSILKLLEVTLILCVNHNCNFFLMKHLILVKKNVKKNSSNLLI